MRSEDVQGVVVRWCPSYAVVWSMEFKHSFILREDAGNFDFNSLYPTLWIAFDVDERIVGSPEGLCTRAFNPRLVRNEYSTNPATIEYDNSQNCEFVYKFIQHEKTIRFKTRLRRNPHCNRPVLFDEFAGDVAVPNRDYEQLIRYNIVDVDALIELEFLSVPKQHPVWQIVGYIYNGEVVNFRKLLCKLGILLHGPGGRIMDRRNVVIPPDQMRPSSARQIGGSAKEFAEERDAHKSLDPTRDERVNRTRRSYRSTTSTETVESRPWGKCASECESSLEVTVNIDCIVVYREMDGSHPKFYVIFSKTHKFGILCDGGINLEVGKWARLRYIGKQLQPGQYLSSKSLCLICYIAPPSLVDVKRYKMTQLPDEEATYIVILTLRAEIECTEDGNLAIQSNVVGSIKVDSEWSPSTRIPRSFPKGAVIEIEFVRDSWFLRKLHGPWNDGFDFRKLDSPYIIPGYTVEEAEYNGRRHPHGMERYRERTASRHRLACEALREISPNPTNSRQNRDRSGFPDNNHTGRCYDEHYTRVPTANNHVSPANYLAENDIFPRASDRTEGVMKQREDPFRDRHEIPSEASDGVERVMKQREDPFRERHEIIWKASDGMDEAMKQGKHPFSDRHFRSYSFKLPEERSSTKLIHDDLYYDIGREGDLLLQENVEDFDIPLDDLELSSNPRCSPMKEPPKQWVPPLMSPNREVIVDLDNEKPSGKNGRCAWCCAVQIRKDYLICYTPVEDIDKILIPASVIEKSSLSKEYQAVRQGMWMNVKCESRTKREYDSYREPCFSHIAVELHGAPVPVPPIKNWEQRIRPGLFQFRVYCDLSLPGNVQRVQGWNEKILKLSCKNVLKVLVPHERLEDLLNVQLTADKTIKFWATRKRRIQNCDLFLIDCEPIEEV